MLFLWLLGCWHQQLSISASSYGPVLSAYARSWRIYRILRSVVFWLLLMLRFVELLALFEPSLRLHRHLAKSNYCIRNLANWRNRVDWRAAVYLRFLYHRCWRTEIDRSRSSRLPADSRINIPSSCCSANNIVEVEWSAMVTHKCKWSKTVNAKLSKQWCLPSRISGPNIVAVDNQAGPIKIRLRPADLLQTSPLYSLQHYIAVKY